MQMGIRGGNEEIIAVVVGYKKRPRQRFGYTGGDKGRIEW